MTAFPQSPLDLRTEIDLAGTWTDISSFVYQRDGSQPPVTITRGRPDESSQVNPASMRCELNNRDGRFSVKNPLGPYFGLLSRNSPVRMSVPGQGTYLRFENDNTSYISAPSSSALNVPGDLEVQFDGRVEFSAPGRTIPLAGKWGNTGNLSWLIEVRSGDGRVNFWVSGSGSTASFVTSTLPLPTAARIALKVTYASGTGVTTWYTAPTISGPWTQLGLPQTLGTGATVFASAAPVQVGNSILATSITGSVYAVKILAGIGGTVVASPDFTSATPGAASVTDAQGNVWTLGGTAEFSNRSYRFHGEMSSLPVGWDASGKDVRVPLQAGGILRRLGQGNAPLMSPMKRGVVSQTGTLTPVQYWPCEDLAGATSFGSATGGPLMFINGPAQPAADSSFVCSNPLPRVNNSAWYGQVPRYTSNGSIVVRFLLNMSTPPALNAVIMRLITNGTATEVQMYSGGSGNLGLKGISSSGSTVFDTTIVTFGYNAVPVWMSIEIQPSGGNVQASLVSLVPGASAGLFGGPITYAGTVGNVQAVYAGPNGDVGQVTVGHISVQSAWQSLFGLAQPLNAWQGEAAGQRFARLCTENGIAARVVGAPGATVPMGAQSITTLTSLLQEIEDADHGMVVEPRRSLGLTYRTQASMLQQPVAVVVDYSQAELGQDDATVLQPTYDDLFTRNDETVQRASSQVSGASFQYQLNDGSAMSISPPSAGVGDYSDSKSVNVEFDSQLPDQAGWLVHLGTVNEARWPQVPVNMSRAAVSGIFYSLLEADVGDFFGIVNPPGQLPPDEIKQLLAATEEQLGGFHYRMMWAGIPESPYEVAVFDDPVYGRADTAGSALALPAAAADTTLNVVTTTPPAWTQAAGDMPFDVGISGERVTVTSIAQAAKPLCRVGAFLNDSAYGAADFTGAYTAWQSLTGLTIGVSRAYYGPSNFGVPLRTDVQEMITAGIKVCIDLQPSFASFSSTDLANMTTFLQALKSAGAEADISLWHEPFFSGLSATQYQNVIAWYGPTVRKFYPLVICLSGGTDTDPANGYYPPASAYDKITVDAYAGSSTAQLTNTEAQAEAAGKPWGVWEFNGATDSVNGQSQSAVTTFFTLIQSMLTSRAARGLPNADLILFSSGNANWLGTGLTQKAGFEGGIGSWQNHSNSTPTLDTTTAHSGADSLKMTSNAAGNMITRMCNVTLASLQANAMPVTAGQIVAANAWFKATTVARGCQTVITIFDATATQLSSNAGTPVTNSTSAWTQVFNNVTAPANAAWAIVETEVTSTGAAGEVHDVDDVYLGIIPATNDLTQAIQFSWDYRISLLLSMAAALNSTSFPQAFTVTRAVNGVSKAHSAGEDVRLWFPPVYAML